MVVMVVVESLGRIDVIVRGVQDWDSSFDQDTRIFTCFLQRPNKSIKPNHTTKCMTQEARNKLITPTTTHFPLIIPLRHP